MVNSKNVATVAMVAMVLALGAAGIVTTIAQIANASVTRDHGPPGGFGKLPPCEVGNRNLPPVCMR